MVRRRPHRQARPLRSSDAAGRRRLVGDRSTHFQVRRSIDRLLTLLAVLTPVLMVVAAQLATGRTDRGDDGLVTIAMAADGVSAGQHSPTGRAYIVPLAELGIDVTLIDPKTLSSAARAEPIRPVLWYQVAGTEHGVSPYLLEALHEVETSAAPDGCWPNIQGSGALGPFQFKRATFALYGVDANNDGVINICGFADSLASAANYLQALGADQSVDSVATRRALKRYGTDPDRVVDLARRYRSRDTGLQ